MFLQLTARKVVYKYASDHIYILIQAHISWETVDGLYVGSTR